MPQKEEATSLFKLIFRHTIFSLAAAAVLTALAAMLVSGGVLPVERSLVAVILAEAIGVFWGGMRASKRAGSRKLPTAALTGFCVFLVLLIAGFLFSFPPAKYGLFVFLAAILPALAGGLVGQKPKKSSIRR